MRNQDRIEDILIERHAARGGPAVDGDETDHASDLRC